MSHSFAGLVFTRSELAAKGTTTEQYRPSLSVVKKRAKAGDGQAGIKDQYIRSFIKCTNCPKYFLLYATQCPSLEDVEAFNSITSDINTCCGKLPLPPHHPLQRLGLQVNHNSCTEPMHMQEQYYSKKIPKTQCFPKLPWPLLCFHCGSADQVACQTCIATFAITHFGLQVEIPQSLRTSFPQCSSCRNKGTPPHETGKAVQNVRAAKTIKAKKQKQALGDTSCQLGCSKTTSAGTVAGMEVQAAGWLFKELWR